MVLEERDGEKEWERGREQEQGREPRAALESASTRGRNDDEDDGLWCFTSVIDAIEPLVREACASPHMELEGRLGRYVRNRNSHSPERRRRFVSGVDRDTFHRTFDLLSQYEKWRAVRHSSQSVDWFFSNHVRHSQHTKMQEKEQEKEKEATTRSNDSTSAPTIAVSERSTVRKQTIRTIDIPILNRLYSLRVRLSREEPRESCPEMHSEPCTLTRCKMRESFRDGNFQYDLTRVASGASVEEASENWKVCPSYEVELEMNSRFGEQQVEQALPEQQPPVPGARQLAGEMIHKLVQLLGLYDPETHEPVDVRVGTFG